MATRIDTVQGLQHDHRSIRTGLRLAAQEAPFLAAALQRLRDLCLPHFEFEEKVLFPMLDTMDGADPAKLAVVREQISGLCRRTLDADHEAITALTSVLLVAAGRQGNPALRELAYLIARHESAENTLRGELRLMCERLA